MKKSIPTLSGQIVVPWFKRLVVAVTAISASCISGAVLARPLDRPVGNYVLDCAQTFSCPESLMPRVSFWVEVFSRWDTNTAIFHDKDNPHRVYSTISRKEGCRRSRKGDSIDREKRRLQRDLRAIAKNVPARRPLTKAQKEIEDLFLGEPVSEVKAAANRIRCQSGNRDRMAEALQQFQLYRPTILDALESQNLTPELQYLPFVESAFNPEALSHVGAAGLWQIMPATGRTLGLTVNHAVDQRYDPYSATYAAAKYFRNSVDNLSEVAFKNGYTISAKELNPFVITSYNYGVKGMERAIRQVGLNYERLLKEYKSPNFQTAVKNFYASFLAARHVAKNREVFFAGLPPAENDRIYSYNVVPLKRATSIGRISKELKVDKDRLKELNPALKKVVFRGTALVPKGYELKLPFRENGWGEHFARLDAMSAEYERPGYVTHRVRRGQTACGIAEQYKASCRALIKLNKLNRRGTIYAGQRIKVPTRNGGISVRSGSSTVAASSNAGTSGTQTYRVQRGDSACSIANRNGMRCGEFLAINGLNRDSVIQVGQRVVVSGSRSWHTVTRGQTACSIANRYRVSCTALLNANQLSKKSTIYVGQKLRIPRNG